MGRFLVIEEHSPLPQWLAKRIGAYLPPAVREETLCGAEGEHLLYHELSSPRARKKAVQHLRDAQETGAVCGLICQEAVRQAVEDALGAPLSSGRLLCASLRLTQLAEKADGSTRITLLKADSELGQAAAVYLAKRVRYLSVDGRRTSILDRLAKRLWQTEGIAVRVGRGEGDTLVSTDDISSPCELVTAGGRCTSPVLAECALLAGTNVLREGFGITARTLAAATEAARSYGIALLPKKDTRAGKFD